MSLSTCVSVCQHEYAEPKVDVPWQETALWVMIGTWQSQALAQAPEQAPGSDVCLLYVAMQTVCRLATNMLSLVLRCRGQLTVRIYP